MTKVQTTKTYFVNVRRDGKWWFFEIPDIDMSGQARKLADVSSEATDIIATWLQIKPVTIEVNLNVEIPREAAAAWKEAKKREATALAENAEAGRLARQAVKQLRANGLTLAETGRVLGVSPQRASQLEAGHKVGGTHKARDRGNRLSSK